MTETTATATRAGPSAHPPPFRLAGARGTEDEAHAPADRGSSNPHPAAADIYADGVAVAMAPVGATPVLVNFPKTGHMTEQTAVIAAAVGGTGR